VLLNARSIRNKFKELQALVKINNWDVIGITESWLKLKDKDFIGEYNLEGYKIFNKDRASTKPGGGVLIYIKENLFPVEITVESDSELIQIEINTSLKINIILVYRPPNSTPEKDRNLYASLTNLIENNISIIIGDFNCPTLNWSTLTSSSEDAQLLDFFQDNFLTQFVNESTRPSSENILDIIMATEDNIINNVEILNPLANSDHNIVKFEIALSTNIEKEDFKTLNFRLADWENLNEELMRCTIPNDLNIEDSWAHFKINFLESQAKHIPSQIHSSSKKHTVTWMNDEIKREIKQRDHLYKQKVRFSTEENINALKNSHRKVASLIKTAQRNEEIVIANNSKINPKKFFSYVKNRKPIKGGLGPFKDEQGVLKFNNNELAEIANNYFVSVFTTEELTELPEPRIVFEGSSSECISNIIINEEQVLKAIHNLNKFKAMGPDEISARVLKDVRLAVIEKIIVIFKLSLHERKVPGDWKLANIVPIHKTGNKVLISNYRPISLTSIIGKLMEGIVTNQITDHLAKHSLILKTAHGFMHHKSCLTNLLEFFQDIFTDYDKERSADIIYLDFQKAFDKVPHKRLMIKVRALGISNNLADWIENWLTDRKQRVIINGAYSDWKPVTSGVPQGSVLGPLLFIIYINDLDCDLISKIAKFADDTKLGGLANLNSAKAIQEDLDKIVKWSETWQMPFNVSKCAVMHIGNKNPNVEYKMKNEILKTEKIVKDLGVYISDDLKTTKHCIEIEKICNRLIGYIKRQFTFKNKEIVITLYNALIRSRLEYAVQFWSPNLNKDIKRLEKIQARVTKLIPEIRNLPYEERLIKLDMISLEARRVQLDMIQVFKIIKGIDNIDYRKFFTLNANPTRNNGYKLDVKQFNTNIMGGFFSHRIIKHWNKLPADVVSAENVQTFKNRLKKIFNEWYAATRI
jgi:hypothetical protein